ncbi:methionyl-tRNA formyltransferase [Hydrogenimonas sp.]|uniref:methionyl-tRNA formyltransferase n=1 Tax=Hydrogenimonas sp. TaxID=2231112 RepID=UPI0026325D48|nr:methionyl-tRNA formyltransferase [Hydrogenimonas sp.]
MLKIGYFADGPWSHRAFEKLIMDRDISIQFICVRYDTKDQALKEYCTHYDIPYLKHSDINSREFMDRIRVFQCNLFISMSFNQIFKSEIISLPAYKTINCHAGKLPFYRGRNILNWALINDEKEFGITVHYVDEGIDTGDIILQRVFPITDKDTYATLLERAYIECAEILYDAVALFKKGVPKGKKQTEIHPFGFYCTQRKFGDEILDWRQNSREIFNFVRAICYPGPQAHSRLHGKTMKINRVRYIENAPVYKGIPGAILQKTKDGFIVKTLDTFVEVIEYEYDGKFKTGDRFEI